MALAMLQPQARLLPLKYFTLQAQQLLGHEEFAVASGRLIRRRIFVALIADADP